jgi:hypothetical protein
MTLKTKNTGNIIVSYQPDEKVTAHLIGGSCEQSVRLSQNKWGLGPPQDCRIYVMTSWLGFVFQAAPSSSLSVLKQGKSGLMRLS